jgi:hypothetical protein
MKNFLRFIEGLCETDGNSVANCAAIMVAIAGGLFCVSIVLASQPYRYQVQCQAAVSSDSHIVFVSRRTGLTTVGPVPNKKGRAAIKSDDRFENYDFTLENKPCAYLAP